MKSANIYFFIIFIILKFIYSQGPIRHLTNPFNYYTKSPKCFTYCTETPETIKNQTFGTCIYNFIVATNVEGIVLTKYEPGTCACKLINLN